MVKYNLILKQIPSLHSITIHIIDGDDSLLYETDHGLTKILKAKSVFDVQCNSSLAKLIFRDNSASLGGNHIYGGWVHGLVCKKWSRNIQY